MNSIFLNLVLNNVLRTFNWFYFTIDSRRCKKRKYAKFLGLKRFSTFWMRRFESFGLPHGFSTKNYTYGRLMIFCLKNYFRLLIKDKLILFIRCNSQIIKFKIQYNFQKAIKTNFGHHYPYYSRLLNYYPYLFVIFFLILCHNFNGLFFYGFTNTAFLLQNFVLSFQAVVGLTILVLLYVHIIFIKCLYHKMYLHY